MSGDGVSGPVLRGARYEGPVGSSSALIQRLIAALTQAPEGTRVAMTLAHNELAEHVGTTSARMDRGETIRLEEALELDEAATLAALAELLCKAYASPDPFAFLDAQMRTEEIAGILDEIRKTDDATRVRQLRDQVEIALASCADLIRGAA